MLIVLFGLSGAGKNFVGEIFAKQAGFHFWDADEVLTQDMKEFIHQRRVFHQEMRNKFTDIMIENIKALQVIHKNLIVAQAMYKEINRQQIFQAFPEAKLIHVQAKAENIMKRLKIRSNLIDCDYAKAMSIDFDAPALVHAIITNDSDENAVIGQCKNILREGQQ